MEGCSGFVHIMLWRTEAKKGGEAIMPECFFGGGTCLGPLSFLSNPFHFISYILFDMDGCINQKTGFIFFSIYFYV